ncbi:MAG: type II toxin-antitoxin system RelE/ParE family toxin [Gemmatimonadaceae bacterium]
MKVVWTPEALQDRLDIWDYISADNRRAAIKIDTLFSNAAVKLAAHPDLGRPGLVSGTRELIPHERYRLVYEIGDETLWVLAVVHTARQWPPDRA